MSRCPTVSVVMPVFNAEKYVAGAVQSVLAQTVTDFELLAVDDGSTDSSHATLSRLASGDRRIRVIRQANSGIVRALNHGIDAARGEFVARMDADDLAFPERFAQQLDFLHQHRDHVAVGSAFLQIDPAGAPIRVVRWQSASAHIEAALLHGQGGLPHPTAMMRTSVLRQVGAYRAAYQWVEDKDLWLRLAEVGRLANLSQVLLAYRIHEASVSTQREAEQHILWRRLLAETYQRRGLAGAPSLAPSSRKSEGLPRWIRSAARSGYFATAAKHAAALIRQRPLRVATWLTLGDAVAQALPAMARSLAPRCELPRPPQMDARAKQRSAG